MIKSIAGLWGGIDLASCIQISHGDYNPRAFGASRLSIHVIEAIIMWLSGRGAVRLARSAWGAKIRVQFPAPRPVVPEGTMAFGDFLYR